MKTGGLVVLVLIAFLAGIALQRHQDNKLVPGLWGDPRGEAFELITLRACSDYNAEALKKAVTTHTDADHILRLQEDCNDYVRRMKAERLPAGPRPLRPS